ncbi:Acg family FMN-binding oxidoreductase [Actinocorallia longicatena]|uniref:Nitroreductase n=1 Tax=Actinocorallia longicatena TaxID=111803 RepID=A0ABP6PWR4_9ACTN
MPSLEETMTIMDWIGAATRAPSLHNTQPWLFRPVPGGIEVHADLTRRLPSADLRGRALHLSLGAAIMNLRIAMRRSGLPPRTVLMPDPRRSTHVATVLADGAAPVRDEDRELYEAISRRRSNREPFEDRVPAAARLAALAEAARRERAVLEFAGDPERDALLSLARTAGTRMRADPAHRDELRRWTTDDPYREDGVFLDAVGPRSARAAFPLRDFAADRETPGRRTAEFEREPCLATLSTAGDGPEDWLRAGQALQNVLLEAVRHGLETCLFTQPLEDPALRDLLGHDGLAVQGVVRIGYGPPAPPTRRRPPEDVLL